jgi:hypothetical protein
MSGKQEIIVCTSAGAYLGTVTRHMRSSLWRANGKAQPVWIGGSERPVEVMGRGANARLVVRLPDGAPLPRELRHG